MATHATAARGSAPPRIGICGDRGVNPTLADVAANFTTPEGTARLLMLMRRGRVDPPKVQRWRKVGQNHLDQEAQGRPLCLGQPLQGDLVRASGAIMPTLPRKDELLDFVHFADFSPDLNGL